MSLIPAHGRRATEDKMNGEKARVGIVGVGRMGLAMVKHLIKYGYQVTACDIDDKQLAKASDIGAAIAKGPAEVARAADFVIVAVGYDEELRLCPTRRSRARPGRQDHE